ncbi:MAG TPA: hypothetical protein VM869_09355 [Enhygromyxa sp.]|nr:hypothetical protein [Enhygromyxa sp.]
MAVQLKIRDMNTGKAQIAEFESIDDAVNWLTARPRFVEVLGPPQRDSISPADEQRLRAALRPLDDDERSAVAAQDQRDAEVLRAAMQREQARAQAQIESLREHNRDADPNRPMHVVWERGHGCRNADPADPREVTELARVAVEAWVAERNSWVHRRGQHVVDAQLVVWPGPVPSGDEDDRIEQGGQFNVLFGDPDA